MAASRPGAGEAVTRSCGARRRWRADLLASIASSPMTVRSSCLPRQQGEIDMLAPPRCAVPTASVFSCYQCFFRAPTWRFALPRVRQALSASPSTVRVANHARVLQAQASSSPPRGELAEILCETRAHENHGSARGVSMQASMLSERTSGPRSRPGSALVGQRTAHMRNSAPGRPDPDAPSSSSALRQRPGWGACRRPIAAAPSRRFAERWPRQSARCRGEGLHVALEQACTWRRARSQSSTGATTRSRSDSSTGRRGEPLAHIEREAPPSSVRRCEWTRT